MQRMNRRQVLVAGVSAAAVSMPSFAQAYPSRNVRIVIPFGAGGPTDVVGRLVGQHLSQQFDQPFVIENVPGAAGTVGIGRVARAPKDGYVIGVSGVGPVAINPFLDNSAPYDPVSDLEFISMLTISESVLVSRADLGIANLQDLIKFAKQAPGRLRYASIGVGSPNHVVMEDLARKCGFTALHVPYTGEAPGTNAMLAGEVDVSLVTLSSVIGFINAKRLVPIAAGGTSRSVTLPNIQTFEEGSPALVGFTYAPWSVLVAPKGIPSDIATMLADGVKRILVRGDVKGRLASLGMAPLQTGATAHDFIGGEISRYTSMIRTNNIKRG